MYIASKMSFNPFEDEVRQAARFLFDYAAACISDDETTAITDQWQHHREQIVSTGLQALTKADQFLVFSLLLIERRHMQLSHSSSVDTLLPKNTACYRPGLYCNIIHINP
jgi:hypothetical protein